MKTKIKLLSMPPKTMIISSKMQNLWYFVSNKAKTHKSISANFKRNRPIKSKSKIWEKN